MRVFITIFLFIALASYLETNAQVTSGNPLYRVISRFDPVSGTLFYDKLD